MPVCPLCYRDNDAVGGRCPACGGKREETPASGRRDLAGIAPIAPSASSAPKPRPQGLAQASPFGALPLARGPAAPPAAISPGAQSPRLILKGAAGEVSEYPLGTSNVLGRSTSASVRLADREVSRKHSEINLESGAYVVKDLGSSNGTFVNGKRIFGPTALAEGDEVLIGTSKMEFRLGASKAKMAEIIRDEKSDSGELEGVVARVEAKANFLPVEQLSDTTQLKRDYERLRIGHQFSQYVRLERDLNELLERILEIAFQLIPCDNGVILLRDASSGELVIQAMRQRKPGQGKVLVSDTLLRQVNLTKQGVLTSDAISDERFQSSHSIIALGVRSAMAVPLLSGDEVKGIMFLDSRERVAAFTSKDLEVLSAIASQASVALENSEYARALEHEATQRAHSRGSSRPRWWSRRPAGASSSARAGRSPRSPSSFRTSAASPP
jgi:adenylate cyclase